MRAFVLRVTGFAILLTPILPVSALANTEPTAYDTRSVSLGLSGVSYLERPAAIAINPALLEGIERFELSVMANPFFVRATSPVQGPNTEVNTELAIGPIGTFFMAGRIAPRVVFGFGAYLEVAYGGEFKGVTQIDGEPTNTTPEDLSVTFFVGEIAFASSFRLSDKVILGVALRLPFARLDADLFANIAPVLQDLGGAGGIDYQRVKNTLSGVGYPSGRVGISYKPIEQVSLGFAYRAFTEIPLTGVANAGTFPTAQASSVWRVPHAIQFGGAGWLLDHKLMLVLEGRIQFHDAKRTGNEDQAIDATIDFGSGPITTTLFIPYDWRNVYNVRIGVEYSASTLIDVRVGTSLANSATSERFAQYFTPPPGFNWLITGGVGFKWEKFGLDLATAYGGGNSRIDESVSQNPDGTPKEVTFGDETFGLCSRDQVQRTGCAGDYKVRTWWASVTFTYKMPTKE